MALTDADLKKIEKVVKIIVGKELNFVKKDINSVKNEIGESESRMSSRMSILNESLKSELLEEIQKVGVEVIQNRSVILQHIQNSPAWKH